MSDSSLTLKDIRSAIQEGRKTCVSIVEEHLRKAEEHKSLNAVLELYSGEALQVARKVDEKIRDGSAGKLAGLVIGIKDNICYKGHKSAAGSRILENFTSLYTSTALQRLLDEDAIVLARLNCDEFAMGSSNENSAFGPVKNALNNKLVPGGSSGGSAVAVQSGICQAALGSDTGGSVRQPASFCGITGFKPSYGRVSRSGLIAYASSFDQISPLSRNLYDAAAILEVMSGHDPDDATSASTPVEQYTEYLNGPDNPLSIGILSDCLEHTGVDPQIRTTLQSLILKLQDAGHLVHTDQFPYIDYAVPAYQILTNAEASSNLSRYAGMLYGHQSAEAGNTEEVIINSRSEGFGREVKRRIMLGTFVLNTGYYEAYYEKAQRVRRLIRDHLFTLLESYDVIMLPSTPTVAFPFGKNEEDPVAMYLEDIFTVPASLAGLPAVSIPAGTNSSGMPYGVQLIGKHLSEGELFRAAHQIQNVQAFRNQ